MKRSRLLFVCFVSAQVGWCLSPFAAFSQLPCNGKIEKQPAAGAKCGAGTACAPPPSSWPPNSSPCSGETLVEQPAQVDCSGAGTTSQGCHETGPTYNCTARYTCVVDTAPDPNRPGYNKVVCVAGTFLGPGSTKVKGVNAIPCKES
jgi:hypothetical protein